MKVKYIYSACIEIDCGGFKILTDPWFTDGIYDGAWYQFPKIDPFEYISKPDLIYISHIHPDHYDPIFLKKLFERFGEIEIVIPDLTPNYLFLKGKLDGIRLTPTRQFKNAQIELFIEENDTGSISDIDSALIVKDLSSNKTLLNLNDCIYNQKHVDKLKEIISTFGGKVVFMAVGYTGAGPYPQTYIDPEKEKDLLISEAENKKQEFFKRYKQYVDFFASEINLPFAREYILGGRLHYLNEYRGVADAFEIKGLDDKAIILSSGGEIDIIT
ncbi:MAG: MBL fold metallo-hydrolase, partial [Alphaproteobacteria bacterium]|nr:MBL fold metallo-hydrolase [Alphaproteobacteria bacterium]